MLSLVDAPLYRTELLSANCLIAYHPLPDCPASDSVCNPGERGPAVGRHLHRKYDRQRCQDDGGRHNQRLRLAHLRQREHELGVHRRFCHDIKCGSGCNFINGDAQNRPSNQPTSPQDRS